MIRVRFDYQDEGSSKTFLWLRRFFFQFDKLFKRSIRRTLAISAFMIQVDLGGSNVVRNLDFNCSAVLQAVQKFFGVELHSRVSLHVNQQRSNSDFAFLLDTPNQA